MKRVILFALLITAFSSYNKSFCQFNNLEFVENKGQWDPKVKFKGEIHSGSIFLLEKGIRVLQHNPEDLELLGLTTHGISHNSANSSAAKSEAIIPGKNDNIITVRSHAYDMVFENAGTPEIVTDKPLNTINNYFIGNDKSKWQGDCKIFQALIYKNLYPGIDVRYYTNDGKLKYDIIVHPGADVTKLLLKFEGVDALKVRNEQLVISTSVGEVKELSPYSYQVINGIKREVPCRYNVAGKSVTFSLGNFDKNSTLIIDPTLIFSTFTGSTADNWGYTATYGSDGSFFAGGIVFGGGFPTSPGAFQTSFQGGVAEAEATSPPGFDIGIMKLDATGRNRLYATYIGGSGNEYPQSIVADEAGNLIIGGRTTSSNYPSTGANIGPCGQHDIVITKINPSGSALVGSRKIGGSGMDGVNIGPKYVNGSVQPAVSLRRNYGDDSRSEIILDGAGNILLASNTRSSDFPSTTGTLQSTFGGSQDAVLIKTNPDVSSVMFSTFLGGSGDDAAFVLAINPSDNNIYIGGNTTSANLPGDKTGVLQSTYQGGITDGFVSIINQTGSTLIKTSYMGTTGNDMLYGIQFDKFSFPYITGTTTGSWTVTNNVVFSQPGGKQFISKLQPDLSGFVYSTVFGTNSPLPNLSPTAFLVDRCENVYVSGWGGIVNSGSGYPNASTSGLTVTPDAIQPTTDGSDFYFFVLERNATKQLYGSFFGQNGGANGEHVDGGTSRFDKNGVIYQSLCANCNGGATFPTTPGVWSPNNPSGNCNLAAVKLAFNLAGVAGSVTSSIQGSTKDTVGCVPLTVDFRDTLAQGTRYIWIFNDGSKRDTTTSPATSHTFNAVGTYEVTLISIDSSKCNIADTARTTITVKTFRANLDFDYRKLDPCDSSKYQFTNTSTVTPAARTFGPQSFIWDFGDGTAPVTTGPGPITHSFPAPGSYNVRLSLVDTNFCNAPTDTVKLLRIANLVDARFETDSSGCAPYNATFANTTIAGETYAWDFGDGTTSTEENPTHTYSTPGTYRVALRVTSLGTCNRVDSAFFTINVNAPPVAGFVFTPDPPQENTPVNFFNTSTGTSEFLWKFGDGDSLFINSTAPVQHTYNQTNIFTTCLVALSRDGCPDTTCLPVRARVLPLLDVPNAFTPNNDGINDKIYVRGFGIIKMTWRIYNRWGTLVFETNNRNEGWDGKYKSELQPKEVYHYTLDVEYSDSSKFQKKGDITLLK